jgi:mannosylfructose-6-phosphate phosphatase
MDGTYLLIADLDGTLLGDSQAVERFTLWFDRRAQHIKVVYTSGRFFDSINTSIRETHLPKPELVICGVGSEIRRYPSGQVLDAWRDHLSHQWNAVKVRNTLAHFCDLAFQPPEFQSDFKVSCFAHSAPTELLDQVKMALQEEQLNTEIVYSSRRDLDVLPADVNKGTAAAFTAWTLGIPKDRVIVCGDSGNDLAMFKRRFWGIVVANAHPELKALEGPNVYVARQAYADGVLEGLKHWLDMLADS